MKNGIIIQLVILLFLFNSCSPTYRPFKMKGDDDCDNTVRINGIYKTNLTLNQMAEKLTSQNFEVKVDTLHSKSGKSYSPRLQILGYNINKQETNWVHFTVFEPFGELIFYGFCLKKPLVGNRKEQKVLLKSIQKNIEKEILPLLF